MAAKQVLSEPKETTAPVIRNRRELLLFLFIRIRETGKWWLLPILIVLAILSLFVSLTGNASILPAIYAFF